MTSEKSTAIAARKQAHLAHPHRVGSLDQAGVVNVAGKVELGRAHAPAALSLLGQQLRRCARQPARSSCGRFRNTLLCMPPCALLRRAGHSSQFTVRVRFAGSGILRTAHIELRTALLTFFPPLSVLRCVSGGCFLSLLRRR